MFFNEALCKYIEWISEDLAFVIFFKPVSHLFTLRQGQSTDKTQV
jgi:hypothetical protein